MKVVLFCGGYGMRMRDGTSDVPKPMQMIGDRPLLWHVMRSYAHYGHTDFILCLGYGARHITDFFLSYEETRSNDFVLHPGDHDVTLLSSDVSDWTITFVHTGQETQIGERLRRVRNHLTEGEVFAANYADVLTNAPLDVIEADLRASGAVGSLLAVPPQAAFHMVESDPDGWVNAITPVSALDVRENGGYFFFTPEVFEHLHEGDDLVTDALPRLAARRKLLSWRHDGFWMPADTVKERSVLDAMARRVDRPWAVWASDGTPWAAPAALGATPGKR